MSRNMTISDLESKDILQINATIIAGALIFLTFLSFTTSVEAENKLLGIIVGSGTILIFSVCSLEVISGKKDHAIRILRAGFVFLMAITIVLAIFALFLLLSNLISEKFHPTGINKSESTHEQLPYVAIHTINRNKA